jgi:hypothetical protein
MDAKKKERTTIWKRKSGGRSVGSDPSRTREPLTDCKANKDGETPREHLSVFSRISYVPVQIDCFRLGRAIRAQDDNPGRKQDSEKDTPLVELCNRSPSVTPLERSACARLTVVKLQLGDDFRTRTGILDETNKRRKLPSKDNRQRPKQHHHQSAQTP